MDLKNKKAIVTGGAIRVGRAITLALAEAGCDVFMHYGRSEAAALETRREAEAHGVSVRIHSADLSDPEAIPPLMEAAGSADILVNSAALYLDGDLASTDLKNWEIQFGVNLRAPFLLSQAFAAQIPDSGSGKIINILDARMFKPGDDHFAYRLTKSALAAMTENLAHDLAPRITVNGVALGAILPPPDKDQSYLDNLAQTRIPLKKAGNPKAVTDNVLHLLRHDFLTGVIIRTDGGEFL
ncbi:MAG: SDR family NAD(P)-dependent oxidoreductase [Verrucomicrobiota bacterium]